MLPLDKPAADETIFRKLTSLSAVQNADTVLCYDSMPVEVDTKRFTAWCCSQGKRLLFPAVMADNSLEFGGEVLFDEDTVCITPALAVDRQNHRLGFGGGCYDRFLQDFSGVSIALCYESCLVDKLPVEETDVAVNIMVLG